MKALRVKMIRRKVKTRRRKSLKRFRKIEMKNLRNRTN